MCVSDRPWDILHNALGQDPDRMLFVEDLTRDIIRLYVRNELEQTHLFLGLIEDDNRCQDLIEETVRKAQGVFLWVFLVARSLLRGLTDADTICGPEKRLAKAIFRRT
jgi:hypothetical protein